MKDKKKRRRTNIAVGDLFLDPLHFLELLDHLVETIGLVFEWLDRVDRLSGERLLLSRWTHLGQILEEKKKKVKIITKMCQKNKKKLSNKKEEKKQTQRSW